MYDSDDSIHQWQNGIVPWAHVICNSNHRPRFVCSAAKSSLNKEAGQHREPPNINRERSCQCLIRASNQKTKLRILLALNYVLFSFIWKSQRAPTSHLAKEKECFTLRVTSSWWACQQTGAAGESPSQNHSEEGGPLCAQARSRQCLQATASHFLRRDQCEQCTALSVLFDRIYSIKSMGTVMRKIQFPIHRKKFST